MKPFIDILIPTFNNPQFLIPCVKSIAMTGHLGSYAKLIIVNNGKQPVKEQMGHVPGVTILEPGKNLGWEGGLAYALERSEAPFVCFQNDDTHIPQAACFFYEKLMMPFTNTDVAAVGPMSTTVMGMQSIYSPIAPHTRVETSYLIFFCAMIRRKHLDEVGGIDTTLSGGDDLDLSMRFRKAGKKLVVTPDAFIIHHGFKTGERIHGNSQKNGGWNSKEMTDRTNAGLIKRHGFKFFMETMRGLSYMPADISADQEGDAVRSLATGEVIYELGVGGRKTVSSAIGIDRIPKGEKIPSRSGTESVADIVADVQESLPIESLVADTVIARHILEHCIDTIQTVKHWNRILKIGGRIIIAVPNQDVCNGIPMNQEHVHAFTPKSLENLMNLCGFKHLEWIDPKNGISFVGYYEKVLHMDSNLNGKELEAVHA